MYLEVKLLTEVLLGKIEVVGYINSGGLRDATAVLLCRVSTPYGRLWISGVSVCLVLVRYESREVEEVGSNGGDAGGAGAGYRCPHRLACAS